tara:strand:- start:1561 stop:2616 length:1056 start_codon:yes stop_codon:yes gene_type:complete
VDLNYSHKVLITSVGGFLGSQNVEQLRKTFGKKIWILSSDVRNLSDVNSLSDINIKLPKGDDKNYIAQVIKYVKKYKINFILPCSDEEAISLSNNLKKFEKLNVLVACQSPDINKIISNKIKTYEVLKKNNIDVPEFRVAKSSVELSNYINFFYKNYKAVVIKDPKARGNRGTIIITQDIKGCKEFNESKELHMSLSFFKKNKKKIINSKYPKLLCERLLSPCYDIDVLAKDGNFLYSVSRERLNPAGVPFKGNIIRRNKKLDTLVKKIVDLLRLSWLVDIDVMTKTNGDPVVIEINPRVSGSSVVSIIAGVPFYKWLLELNLKKNISFTKHPKDGLTVLPKVVCEIIKTK